MAGNSRRKGGALASVVWFLVIASIIVAFFRVPTGRETDGIGDTLVAKSDVMKTWVTTNVSKIDFSGLDDKLKLFS